MNLRTITCWAVYNPKSRRIVYGFRTKKEMKNHVRAGEDERPLRMTKLERKVIETAMAEYRRLVKLGWNRTYFGKGAKKHWLACRALAMSKAHRRHGDIPRDHE